MVRGRLLIPWLSIAAVFLVFTINLAVPQSTALAKEPFSFPSSDNETSIDLSAIGCPGGIAIDNGIININHFKEAGECCGGLWLYPDGYSNCYQELPFLSYGANLPRGLYTGTFIQCYPITGTPGNWYEAIIDLDLDGGAPDVEVHRDVMVPSGQSYFLAKYTINNIKGSSLPDLRLFQGVDYDIATSFTDDEGGYSRDDFVWEHDLGSVGTYVGFVGDKHSAHHDVNYFSNMWSNVVAGNLNDADYYKGDTGVALEWDLGNMPAGGSESIIVTFAFAPSYNKLTSILSPSIVQQAAQPTSSPPSEIPPMKLKQAILSTMYARVTPQQTYANQPVTISTNVVNSGDDTGNYNVVLKINGQVEETKMVSVGPGGAYPVKFTVTKAQPGTYTASIDGHQIDFVVLGDKTSTSSLSGGTIALLLMGVLFLVVVVVLMLSFRRSV
jgi:hypothetical protein